MAGITNTSLYPYMFNWCAVLTIVQCLYSNLLWLIIKDFNNCILFENLKYYRSKILFTMVKSLTNGNKQKQTLFIVSFLSKQKLETTPTIMADWSALPAATCVLDWAGNNTKLAYLQQRICVSVDI
jgi:hypothetical protein